jgi:O-acetyl-ADP-ribose deacetylase (regulator of RNase III)
MSIVFKDCNMFEQDVNIIVNTVNTVGVMGKGVALQVKKLSKENFKLYQDWCKQKPSRRGSDFCCCLFPKDYNKTIYNMATKEHWRQNSKYEWINIGLLKLKSFLEVYVEEFGYTTIAIPPLGCGNGGLDWNIVWKMIHNHLSGIENVNIIVCKDNK